MIFSKKIPSPIGPLFLVANQQALIALDNNTFELFTIAQESKTHEILNKAHKQLDEYFAGKRLNFSVPLEVKGTPFQIMVWEALKQIPFGEIWSYGKQAMYLKKPKAFRAVGAANGKNPIAIIIPCHRVVGSTGKLTGYSSGMKMKVELLQHEGHLIEDLIVRDQS